MRSPWQKLLRNCEDISIVSESLVPEPLESSLSILINLPEKPTIILLNETDYSEKNAQHIATGADIVLNSQISYNSIYEVIESTLESRKQINYATHLDQRGRITPKIIDFICKSEEMQIFIDQVRQIIPSDSVLLILGEAGVGKEHLAKAIHAKGHRSSGPFMTVNTAALPEQLLESELFGHERGAFTGAIRSRRGAFELAHGGTIFLYEIGEMPIHLQTKILRVLQDFEVTPIGSEKSIWTDVRVITATNRNIEKEIENGNFRQDLYYRISVVTLTIPPLRKRKEDIPAMALNFISIYKKKSDEK